MKALFTHLKKNTVPMLIQTRRWLMQPKIWRFVGFASAVVGLLCYALSSSFKHLFGKWNLLKIFLYTVFSFIIILMILYANIWQHSRSLRFKAHTAFLVLTITSVYSFFFDKVMNGKPDAYSLISCASFAIMSLSLSRQTQCGFEVDLLYFFLGCLIVLLMKIKFQLFVVGAGFSYCLIILRSYFSSIEANLVVTEVESLPVAITNVARTMEDSGPQDASSPVIEVDLPQLAITNVARMMEDSGPQDTNSVAIEEDPPQLASTDVDRMMEQLGTRLKALQQENLNLIHTLSKHVKEYLKDDSSSILPLELSVSDSSSMIEALPPELINDLQKTAESMVSAGLEKEFSGLYISYRKKWLEECLINKFLGLQEINIMNEDEMVKYVDKEIRSRSSASEVGLRILFHFEQRLCEIVFSGFSPVAARCFKEICHRAIFQQLIFAEGAAQASASSWRLFKMLTTLETLSYLIPKFLSLFPDSSVNEAKNRLGDTTSNLFVKLKYLIFHVPVAERVVRTDGQHHPMTALVMSYLVSACRSRRLPWKFLEDYPEVSNRVEASFSFITLIEWMMETLETYLIAKSEEYKNLALRCVFMMNNRWYIEINKSWVSQKLGHDWFKKNRAKIQELELSQRSTWNKVLDFLKLDNNDNVTAELLKDKLNSFNRKFKKICRVQSTWCVYDKKLREEIINTVLTAYGIFIGRLHDILGNDAYKYIEYGMKEIQDKLNNLLSTPPPPGIQDKLNNLFQEYRCPAGLSWSIQ